MSAVSQNLCLSGFDFGDSLAQGNEELWCSQNSCLSGLDFGDSLAQGNEELWCSQNSCLSGSDFGNWKGVKFAEKIYIFWAILRCVIDALSKSFCAGGRSESALVISFYVGFET